SDTLYDQKYPDIFGFSHFLEFLRKNLDQLNLYFDHAKNKLQLTFYSEDSVTRAFRRPTRNS
ncbi:hypothetical protein AVEN_64159-2-1, partial [Araneus ventricosus]